MTEPLIQLRHVTVVRGSREVLHDISLDLFPGEHLAILGPNGCGKTTLVKTLTCELYPTPGPHTEVRIFGRARWDLTELRRRLGVVSADAPPHSMLPLSGRDAVLTGFFSSSRLWPHLSVTDAMRQRAETLLVDVGAGHLSRRAVESMSSGEQRRVLIARALAGSGEFAEANPFRSAPDGSAVGPEMLLLDEPSNNLDLGAQRDFQQTLSRIARKRVSILLITHHVSDIIPEMNRVLLMKEGRIFRDGDRREVLSAEILSELFTAQVSLSERHGVLSAY